MANNNKMKGLLKGLRYISQMFENEKEEPEMQIGYPTNVKHVAHIGWDGPSEAPPGWMNEFKGTAGDSSGPSNSNNEDMKEENPSLVSEDLSRSREIGKETMESMRRSRSGGGSPTKEKSEKSKHSKKSSRTEGKARHKDKSQMNNDSTSSMPPTEEKKTRRRRSKNGSDSKASRTRAQTSDTDCSSISSSMSKSLDAFEEDTEGRFP